jgi:hypothetical protein
MYYASIFTNIIPTEEVSDEFLLPILLRQNPIYLHIFSGTHITQRGEPTAKVEAHISERVVIPTPMNSVS